MIKKLIFILCMCFCLSFYCQTITYASSINNQPSEGYVYEYAYNCSLDDIPVTDYLKAKQYAKAILKSKKLNYRVTGPLQTVERISAIWDANYFPYEKPKISVVVTKREETLLVNVKNFQECYIRNKAISKEIDKISSTLEISSSMTDYEILQKINAWFVDNVKYDYSLEANQISDVVFHKKGICSSISATFQAICNHVGVSVEYVTGYCLNLSSEHAWNQVQMDGKNYFIDSTWEMVGVSSFMDTFEDFVTIHGPMANIQVHKRVQIPKLCKLQYKNTKGVQIQAKAKYALADNRIVLPKISRKGYKFLGWYSDKKNMKRVSKKLHIRKDIVLYAKWKKMTFPKAKKKLRN